jgi:replicative superfamily II helicase
MALLRILVSFALALFVCSASAERVDGIEFGETNNLLLQRLASEATTPTWQDPQMDLQVVGYFGDGTFWISDKSVRRNWQEHVIFKLVKMYDKTKYLSDTDEKTQQRMRIAYTANESVIELNCAQKAYSVKAEAFYDAKQSMVRAQAYKEEFIGFKKGSAVAWVHQQYCF